MIEDGKARKCGGARHTHSGSKMNKISVEGEIANQDKVLMLQVFKMIQSVKYGYVQITIHDSHVVQIDKTEKMRIRSPRDGICK